MKTQINIKRIYDAASDNDGTRILVDRLWPRGLTKEKAKVDFWLRDIAPSTELRRKFRHDPEQWSEFKKRYFAELDANKTAVQTIREKASADKVTLLFAAKNTELNNAVALKEYLTRSDA